MCKFVVPIRTEFYRHSVGESMPLFIARKKALPARPAGRALLNLFVRKIVMEFSACRIRSRWCWIFPEPNRKMDNFIHFSEHPTPVSLLVSVASPFCHACVVLASKASILQRSMESYIKTQQRTNAMIVQMEAAPTRARCTWGSHFGAHQWASIGTTPFAVSLPAGSARSWLTSAL